MPVTRLETVTLYQYEELSDAAKQTARDWWREASVNDLSDEWDREDFERVAEILGVDLKTHEVTLYGGGKRRESNVWWSLGYCQGDFAGFDASYSYAKGSAKAIRAYAPQDTELHRIADALQAVQARNCYRITAKVTHSDRDGMTTEAETTTAAGDWADLSYEANDAIGEAMRDLGAWLYSRIRAEDEYRNTEENIREAIEANEYTFDEDGNRRD